MKGANSYFGTVKSESPKPLGKFVAAFLAVPMVVSVSTTNLKNSKPLRSGKVSPLPTRGLSDVWCQKITDL